MEVNDSNPDSYIVTFTRDEALVLEGLLARWDGSDDRIALVLEDQAEQRLLWDLTCVVVEGAKVPSGATMLTDDWLNIIENARSAIRDPDTSPGVPGLVR